MLFQQEICAPVTTSIADKKASVRRQAQDATKAISPRQQAPLSAAARDRLVSQKVWADAESVLLFAPMPGELDVWPLVKLALDSGRLVALPRFDRTACQYAACRIRDCTADVQHGYFNIREPGAHCELVALKHLDFVLVPGIAFDLHGRRLGRGKGHYDRLLANVRGVTCGAGFDEQIVEAIPVESHDVDLNRILTPTRWVVTGARSWNELAG